MSSKFIHRLKKRLLIPTLTMLVIVSQIAPLTASAATNNDIMDLINSSGTEISIVIDEDAVAAPVKSNKGKHTSSNSSNDNDNVGDTYKSSNINKDGYSSDGRKASGGYTDAVYDTTLALSEANMGLKNDLDNYFGEKNLIITGMKQYSYCTALWNAITQSKNNPVAKALNSKTQRLELGKIAVKNDLVSKDNYAASHLVGLFTYYGVINRDDGLLQYSNSSKAYVTRAEATLMLSRFMHPDTYFDLSVQGIKDSYVYDILGDSSYAPSINHYTSAMLIDNGLSPYTKKELNSPMTRIEFITMLIESYFFNDRAAAHDTKATAASIFKDIDKGDYVTTKWEKSRGITNAKANDFIRAMLKDGKITEVDDDVIEAAYNLGILKKDAKGNANLFKNITYSQAIRMLADSALAQNSGKAK